MEEKETSAESGSHASNVLGLAAAAQESDSQFRAIATLVPVGIYITDSDGNCLYANPAWCQMAGLRLDDALGQGWIKGLHPDDRASVFANWNQMTRSKGNWGMDYRFQTPEGKVTSVYGVATPQYDASGKILRYVGVNVDITARKQAEQALRLSESRYHSIIEDQVELICRYLPNGRLTFVNGAYARYYKMEPADLVNNNFIPNIPEPDLSLILNRLRELKKDSPVVSYTHRIIRPSGEIRWQEWTQRGIYSDDGSLSEYQAVGLDITERKQAENQINKLNRTYAMLSDVSKALVRVPEPQTLFDEICRILVHLGGFRMAWVGMLDTNSGDVHTVARSGATGDYLEKLKVNLRDESRSRGPTGMVIRTGQHVVCSDIEHDESMASWRKDALRLDYRSSAAFPIQVAGETRGTINLYSSEKDFFDGDEIVLLDGMARDTSIVVEFAERESQRKRIEMELQISERHWRATFDAINDAVALVTADGEILNCNQAHAKLFGKSRSEIIGRHCFETIYGTSQRCVDCPITRARQSNRRENLVMCFGDRWFDVAVDPVLDAHGQFTSAVHIMSDITESKKTQEALLESRKQYRDIVEGTQDLVTRVDTNGRFLFLNHASLEIYGLAPEECVGRVAFDFIASEDREATVAAFSNWLKSGEGRFECQNRQVGVDGRVHDMAWVISPERDQRGNVIGFASTGRDITVRKRMEELQRQAHKMESIGTLAGGIAHDFNNILMALTGYAEAVYEDLPEHSDGQSNQSQVLKAAERAKQLVRQILAFGRIGNGQLGPVQVGLEVKEALNLMRASIPATIEIRQEVSTEVGLVMAPPAAINQVVVNICTNAYHAMRENGGILAVVLKKVDIGADGIDQADLGVVPGNYILLAISDTGVGIAKDVIDKIFDPYFTTKIIGEGSGLGLSVVHGIVKSIGGHITVESEPGRGSIFRVYLPRIELPATPVVAEEPATDPFHGTERILVVDDEEAIVELYRSRLSRLGYKVTACDSSEQALELFRQQPDSFDVLITDMTMPKMTGLALAGKILAVKPGMPIILCTGFSGSVNEEIAKAAGIAEYVTKPVTPKDMACLVRKLFDMKAR